jgi:ABC-type branched-subunit amino acid transport system substrate-binding protein
MSSSPRQRAYATVALAFLVLLTGCGAEQGPNKQPPRLAVIVEASGPNASLGVAGRNGMQLAVGQTNASGSIHGRFINVE